jgi:MFS family permease
MAWATAMAVVQLFASGLSDRVGRRLPIVAGMLLQAVFFGGLASAGFGYVFIVAGALIAGTGSALVNPAITAQLMDISEEQYRGRVMGAYASTGSLGGVTGPLLVVAIAGALGNQGVFATAALFLLATALAAALLSGPRRSRAPDVDSSSEGVSLLSTRARTDEPR